MGANKRVQFHIVGQEGEDEFEMECICNRDGSFSIGVPNQNDMQWWDVEGTMEENGTWENVLHHP